MVCSDQLKHTVFLAQSIEVVGWVLLSHSSVWARDFVCSTIAPEQVVKRDFDFFVVGNLCIDESLLFCQPLIEDYWIHGALACGTCALVWGVAYRGEEAVAVLLYTKHQHPTV